MQDQIAIVTGGAKGIGLGVCKAFCEQEATVIAWDILEPDSREIEQILSNGGHIDFRKTDITDRKDVKNAVEEVITEYGQIDVLINNAGIIRDRTLHKMIDEDWDKVISVNLTGIYNVTKTVLPYMRQAGYGRIISASSINGVLGAFGQTNYAASKAGIIGFTKALAKEVGKYGITANAIAPGFIKTDMTDSIPRQVVETAIAQIPVKRIGTVKDMAYAYLFLASRQAGFINGHVLHANGGAF